MTIDVERRRAELLDLRGRLVAVAEERHQPDGGDGEINSSAGDQHIADHASETFQRELDDTLAENADKVLYEIDAALRCLDEGTYGTCSVCGSTIPEERLEAVPYATLCVEDQRRQAVG